MPKIMMFIKRKPGLSFDEFQAHYETVHVPLAKKLLVNLSDYSRNFLRPFPGQAEPEFDCVTELWFADESAMHQSLAFFRTPEAQALVQDEGNFMDRSATRAYVSTEIR